MKNAVGGGTADNANAGVKKAVAIGGGCGIADKVNKERPLGRRDIITDSDNGFLYQPCVNSKVIVLLLVRMQLTVGSEGLRPPT